MMHQLVRAQLRATVLTAMCLIAAMCGQQARAAVRVNLADGALESSGAHTNGVRAFLGIPFAQPPVGALRWRPPQAAARWQGVRKADQFGARCMQDPVFGDIEFRSKVMSEDCLYLNVWTTAKSARERQPVLVYFHGGGFVAGDGSESRYDGASTARHGIVVVTVNYRLGLFGFLAHPDLSREASYQGSGNYGLLDQVAALRWVRANIAAFGGNPERITIGGESAGSISVSALMASPLSRDLIAGAIGESGSVLGALPAAPLAKAEQDGLEIGKQAGATSIADLRALPAARVLEATRGQRRFATPTIDGHFFPKSPYEIYRAGEHARVPLLTGSNSEEGGAAWLLGSAPATLQGYRDALEKLYGQDAGAVLKAYPATADGEPVIEAAQALASDRFIAYSTWKWIELVTKGNPQTFYYFYTRRRPPFTPEAALRLDPAARDPNAPRMQPRGAVHAAEIEYALGNLDVHPVYQWQAEDHEVSRTLQGYFVNFIKTGDPNGAGLPRWPTYASAQRMVIDVKARAERDPDVERRQAVGHIVSPENP